MRILFIDTTTDSKEIGGGHLFLPDLMAALISRGHDVHLVTRAQHNSRLAKQIENSGASVHISPWKKKEPVTRLVLPFVKWVETLNPDVYVISGSAAIGWLALPSLPQDLPTYMIGHNDEKTYYMPVKHYSAFLSGTIGVSHQICHNYIADCGVPESKVTWIPYGVAAVDSIRHSINTSPIRIAYVGRIEKHQKRILDLAKVINELTKTGIPFSCDIVGDGSEKESFLALLEHEISTGSVAFHGWLPKADVLTVLQKADIFLLTSAFEGFSIALTEAMANGCCPIVTDIKAGNQQLVKDGVNGYLVKVGDISGFTGLITSLVSDRQKLDQIRLEAWRTGMQYSVERMAEKYEDLFLNGLAGKRSDRALPDPTFPILSSCYSKYPMWLRRVKAKLTSIPAV